MKRIENQWLGTALTAMCAVSLALNVQAADLPSKVCFSVTGEAGFGLPSYQDLTMVISGQSRMFDSWCITANVPIQGNYLYTAEVLTPAEAAGLVVHPDNFDLVAWILNQNYQGQASPSGGTYTFGDVQVAIWMLIDDEIGNDMGPYDPARVTEILAAAAANGEGFVPACGQKAIMVLKPVLEGCDPSTTSTDLVTQPLIIEVPAPCEGPGTGTPGYWGQYRRVWPVQEITIGGTTYTKDQAVAGIRLPVKGDKRWTIFAALVSAKLNVIVGNDSSCVASEIAQGDAWWAMFGNNPVAGRSEAWKLGEPLYLYLDDYNNGRLCAPSRD